MTNIELLVSLMIKHADHPVNEVGKAGITLFAMGFDRAGMFEERKTFICRAIGKALVEYADIKDQEIAAKQN